MEKHLETQSPISYFFLYLDCGFGEDIESGQFVKCNIVLISWCCMCKANGETIDHLFLHSLVVRELWAAVFNLFGMSWVMPRRVIDL